MNPAVKSATPGALLSVAVTALFCLCLQEAITVSASTNAPAPELQPFHRILRDGKEEFSSGKHLKGEDQKTPALFHAVAADAWPPGLAPIFAVEKDGRIELRRRPLTGHENYSEPLFFALAPEDEPEAARITGRWSFKATRQGQPEPSNALELLIDGRYITGRFDQTTDLRFAQVASGTLKSNRFELKIDYISDSYLLTAEFSEGRMKGEWRHVEDHERGEWEASRPAPLYPANARLSALYQWTRLSDQARRYALDGETLGPEWERSTRPLCRVWIVK